MPTYDYKCTQCGLIFEKLQNISDDPVTKCPECNGNVKRLLSGGAGVLVRNSSFFKADVGRDTCCSRGESCDNPKRCCESQ